MLPPTSPQPPTGTNPSHRVPTLSDSIALRAHFLSLLETTAQWDVIVIGGGATGLGCAMDAASRGYQTLLVEQSDFSKGTSSKSTKLLHGGVRYMAQGDIGLVKEACHERGLLIQNAPHLSRNMSFVIPNYTLYDNMLYAVGLKFYDLLAGRLSLGKSEYIGAKRALDLLPNIKKSGLKGGVLYHDGQFDDARLALNIAQTAMEQGACVLNYTQVTDLLKDEQGKVVGVQVRALEENKTYAVKGKVVLNATGVYADNVLQMDRPDAPHFVRPSQGVHLTLDRSFLDGNHALMIPKTSDGRVLFAIPWHNKLIVGTTDTLVDHPDLEPQALEKEIDFILKTAALYLVKKPTRQDVRSVFAGLRPLAAPQATGKSTKEISRSHKIIVSPSGLITIIGGKWTTFRKMAEDAINKAIATQRLSAKPCRTASLHIHGYDLQTDCYGDLYFYGTDIAFIRQIEKDHPSYAEKLHPHFDYTLASVLWAVRAEMAQRVEDVLARRLRLLLLDAKAALSVAKKVAEIMAKELGKPTAWVEEEVRAFTALAERYIL